jgi:RecJ-like exonuclease
LMKTRCIQWNTSRSFHLFLHPSRNACNFPKIYTLENHCTMYDLTVYFVFLGCIQYVKKFSLFIYTNCYRHSVLVVNPRRM